MSVYQRHLCQKGFVVGTIPSFIQFELRVEFFISEEWQQQNPPTKKWLAIFAINHRGRQVAVSLVVINEGFSNLLQVLCRLGAVQLFLNFHNRGDNQNNKN